jgi:hypothetical protein
LKCGSKPYDRGIYIIALRTAFGNAVQLTPSVYEAELQLNAFLRDAVERARNPELNRCSLVLQPTG